MTNSEATYAVAGGCGLLVLIAFGVLILRPAWASYTGIWQRMAAAFLSLYVLATFVGIGVAGGLAITWFWDRIEG